MMRKRLAWVAFLVILRPVWFALIALMFINCGGLTELEKDCIDQCVITGQVCIEFGTDPDNKELQRRCVSESTRCVVDCSLAIVDRATREQPPVDAGQSQGELP